MYRRIMVAVDGSETANQALVEAVNIANTYSGKLCIVHAISGDTEADKKAGLEILGHAQSYLSAISIETRLLKAEAEYGLQGITGAIADAVSDWGADLLVVGTANRRGLERFFIGSVAEQLLAKVQTSILLIRPENQLE
ncbi:MAG TPA: hypothetical protein DEO56_06265 [Nitrosomonas nitrosa]|uniref:universal stress protein n=1 Tax=Nitrosomonas nitrosa TaxID=52442 RepID=UPI000EE76632|nr:universal stress protein [Nitrosomonas nitrosa]MCO6434101.1 universal stress protein [Nitrosomonas nitrosa]HBZ30186.1 hypothetical protein [Nitrosomonas nitrosa]HNP52893.1 universal stress protein [Nitrosomonas nitrosa]